jgi:hypothetical protein
MRQLYACYVLWLKWNVRVSAHLANDTALNDRNVLDSATVAKRDSDDLIAHTSLRLRGEKLTPD